MFLYITDCKTYYHVPTGRTTHSVTASQGDVSVTQEWSPDDYKFENEHKAGKFIMTVSLPVKITTNQKGARRG